jgi:nitrile hydratase
VRKAHDLGGRHGFGRVVVAVAEPVFHQMWEGRVHGIVRHLTQKGVFHFDEFRHAQEQLPADQLRRGYYERWLAALERLVPRKLARGGHRALRETHTGLNFKVGDAVVAQVPPASRHTRIPAYAQNRVGLIESIHAPAKLPDTNALQLSADWEPVYTVVFRAEDLWESGERRHRVSVDLWQRYLRKVPTA